jgi:hypothetical protein
VALRDDQRAQRMPMPSSAGVSDGEFAVRLRWVFANEGTSLNAVKARSHDSEGVEARPTHNAPICSAVQEREEA